MVSIVCAEIEENVFGFVLVVERLLYQTFREKSNIVYMSHGNHVVFNYLTSINLLTSVS